MAHKKEIFYKEYIDQKIEDSEESYQIGFGPYFSGLLAHHLRPLWVGFGNIESEYIRLKLDHTKLDQSIYITGLARSGTTTLLNFLYETGQFASLTYRSYPFVYLPYLWHKISGLEPNLQPAERAHFDRILINSDSPEALEETIWRYFFSDAAIQKQSSNPKFEQFYSDFVKKILLLNGKNRYLAKGNYNFARIPYIAKINPSAKFIICIRDPLTHIESLIKQHYLFETIEKKNPRIEKYMKWMGHNEFGLTRRPTYLGNDKEYKEIVRLWDSEQEIEGWALQWNYIYNFVYEKILALTDLSEKVFLLRYEDLCQNPKQELLKVLKFCELDTPVNFKEKTQQILAPSYYKMNFSQKEKDTITNITKDTKSLFYT